MNLSKRFNRSRLNLREGFTVVEMLVVVTIMVLLMSLLTQFGGSGNDQRKLKMSADKITGAIEQARTYAMANNTYTWVALHSDTTNRVVNTLVVASKTGLSNALAANAYSLLGTIQQSENTVLQDPKDTVFAPSVNFSSLPAGSLTVPYQNTTRSFSNAKLIRFSPLGEAVDNEGYPLNGVGIGITLKPKGSDVTPPGVSPIEIHVNGYTGKTILNYSKES